MEREITKLVNDTNLKHIAIIMDGNRRWAKVHHLPTAIGHKKGVEALRKTVRACDEAGVKYITVYAFSTENWNRKPDEVDFLMSLVIDTLISETDDMHRENVKIKFLGSRERLSDKLKDVISKSEEKTKNNTGVNLQIAFNYGSRSEIADAVKSIVKDGISADMIDEGLISDYLYTAGIPDPDILIRTGGEQRISNYLLWQIAYSEIIIRNEFWPDFGRESLFECINEFGKRQRRYGK